MTAGCAPVPAGSLEKAGHSGGGVGAVQAMPAPTDSHVGRALEIDTPSVLWASGLPSTKWGQSVCLLLGRVGRRLYLKRRERNGGLGVYPPPPPMCSQGSWDQAHFALGLPAHPGLGTITCAALPEEWQVSLWEKPRGVDPSPVCRVPPTAPLLTASCSPPPGSVSVPEGAGPPPRGNSHPQPNKLSAGRRMVRKGEQLWEQEALQENGQTDGETEFRSPSVSDGCGGGRWAIGLTPTLTPTPSLDRRGQVAAGRAGRL